MEENQFAHTEEGAELIAELRGRAPVRQTARPRVVGEPTPIAEQLHRRAEAQELARPGGHYDYNTTQPHPGPDPIALCLLRLARRGRELREGKEAEIADGNTLAGGSSATQSDDHQSGRQLHCMGQSPEAQVGG
jgi:hypothetical protein